MARKSYAKSLLLAITILSVLLAVVIYGMMPEKMVTHWGIYGEPNGWMGRLWGVASLPLINLFMLAIYFFVPKFEPKKENLAGFRSEYDKLMLWIFMILNYIFVLCFLYNLGIIFDMGRMVMPAIGVMYIVIGVIMPKTKQNYMVGIRTPWTLASERVWKRTHEFGGKLFVISGIATALAIFLPSMWGFVVLIGSVILSTIMVMFYSWKEYHLVAKK